MVLQLKSSVNWRRVSDVIAAGNGGEMRFYTVFNNELAGKLYLACAYNARPVDIEIAAEDGHWPCPTALCAERGNGLTTASTSNGNQTTSLCNIITPSGMVSA
ncbi:MAG: hypothetical protein H6661_08025 [Ardenticatenaceae bacterium]|nr:hypothetical protein [Ardenticatenaceae bacterium]